MPGPSNVYYDNNALNLTTVTDALLSRRISAIFIILVVSLIAVSFPGLSSRSTKIRIPHVAFFIGKHFGTGVILATAFCHLLPDAFTSLQDPEVIKYLDIRNWIGLIILASLLLMFLIEYISTSYVDRLHAEPSEPSSPESSPSRTSSRPMSPEIAPVAVVIREPPPSRSHRPVLSTIHSENGSPSISDRTPLIAKDSSSSNSESTAVSTSNYAATSASKHKDAISFPKSKGVDISSPKAASKSRYRSQSLDEGSYRETVIPFLRHVSGNPRYINILGDRNHHRCCCTHDEFCGRDRTPRTPSRDDGRRSASFRSISHSHAKVPSTPSEIVEIFAPQPSAKDMQEGGGHDHHVHENSHGHGHSHGHSHGHGHGHGHSHGIVSGDLFGDAEAEIGSSDEEVQSNPRTGRRRQIVGILVLQLGIMIHSLVIGLTLSITQAVDFTSLLIAIIFHQLFEGLSLGIRIAALPPSPSSLEKPGVPILAPTLSALFAITTPAGILIGLLSFNSGDHSQLRLTQGLMSAISVGMLIYASCVEMLAGDFVMDPHMHMGPGGVSRQVVALSSLLLGVAGMTLID